MYSYIRLRGKVFGPYDEAQLKKMRDTGKIGRTTEISEDGIAWRQAVSFELLYPKTEQIEPPVFSSSTILPPLLSQPEPEIWFYSDDGRSGLGPVTKSSVVELLRTGQLNGHSHLWRQGEHARTAKNVPEFSAYFPERTSSHHSSKSNGLWGVAAVLLFMICVVGILVFVQISRSANNSLPVTEAQSSPEKTEDGKPKTDPATAPPTSFGKTEDIVELVEPSVARIEGLDSGGAGFLIRSGVLATNHHVIQHEFIEQVKIHFPSVSGVQKGPFETKLLYFDRNRDIAFLSVQSDLPTLPLAENHRFKRGQDIIVIGSPKNLENAVNIGVLSSEKKIAGQDYYQLGISINSGNSGGPVMDRNGRIIGIVTLKSTEQEGIAFCIPVANIRDALSKMEKLTESEKAQNNSRHRAEVALRMLAFVNLICRNCMKEYDTWMKIAIEHGDSANDGINFASRKIDEKMEAVQYVFLDKVEKELENIQKDPRLSKDFQIKLAEFYSNCMEIKSYVDNPRGTVDTYKAKLIELVDTGDRLFEQLALILGILPDEDETL